ncbi:hypothetical protein P2318_17135 [Myxococcaceae bacterium GXIMD 01537]
MSKHSTHSAAGSRFMERLLTVSASLRARGRSVLTFLRETVTAAFHGNSARETTALIGHGLRGLWPPLEVAHLFADSLESLHEQLGAIRRGLH